MSTCIEVLRDAESWDWGGIVTLSLYSCMYIALVHRLLVGSILPLVPLFAPALSRSSTDGRATTLVLS